MNVDAWTTVSRLLDEALDVPPDERAQWVDALPGEHDSLKPRLRALLDDGQTFATHARLDTIPKIDDAPGEHGHEPHHASDASGAFDTVGPYSIVRKLAEGGMGAVWLARRSDGMVNRPIALKLPRGSWERTDLAQRIAREREILAAFAHPNIARLYDAGLTANGQPYLALEYVEGQPIDDYVRTRQLPLPARLRLFLQVTCAVAHAHTRLIVHSDLKPANILVTAEGEVKLLDFGIAKLLQDDRAGDTRLTQTAGRPFTPDYASPEQIGGQPLGVGSDIYSLGVLLYELLTGVRPYVLTRRSRRALEEAILLVEPRRPSDVAPDPATRQQLRGDLDAIVLHALQKHVADRYSTVDAFAADITRHVEGRPVLARPAGVWYRLSKGALRHRRTVGAAAAVLIALLTSGAVASWHAHVASREKAQADEVSGFLTTMFRDASPYGGRGRALSATEWLQEAKSRLGHNLDDRPELRVELLNNIGSSLLMLQDTGNADTVLTEAVDEAMRRLGPDHPQTLRARVLRTGVYRFRGTTADMRRELADVLPTLRSRADTLAESLTIALKNQAHLEIDDGRYREAEAAAREAVDVGSKRLGAHHPETVVASLVLAYAQQSSRPPDVALRTAERALELTRAAYPGMARHPRVIEARLVYGRALAEAGHVAEGVEELERVVRDASDVFGPTSRMVGFFSLPLARFQLELGEVDAALESAERALAIISTHSTPDSFRYAVALHRRGNALAAAGRPAEALPDLTRAASTLLRLYGPAHPMTRAFQAAAESARARLQTATSPADVRISPLPASSHVSADRGDSRRR
jgi:serine/threonine-protein kinase